MMKDGFDATLHSRLLILEGPPYIDLGKKRTSSKVQLYSEDIGAIKSTNQKQI
jgi:hypothetical protein